MLAGAGYVLGSKYPMLSAPFLFKSHSEIPPQSIYEDEHSLELEKAMHSIGMISEHIPRSIETPSAQRAREAFGITYPYSFASKEQADYVIMRPFINHDPSMLESQLTAGSLRGRDKLAVNPIVFSKTEAGVKNGGGAVGDGFAIVHVGKNLAGFAGLTHGGLIATMFDEALARSAFYGLPNSIGVTGKLEVRYLAPAPVDRFYAIETRITESLGRKCFVTGTLLDPDTRKVYAEASAVFIEPKWAKYAKWVGGVNVKKLMEE